MGVSLTIEAETKRHMCQCVYVYFWVFAKVGWRVPMLLRVSHCIRVCVHLLVSLGVMEDVWLDACDIVRVWERKGQQGRGKMKLTLENFPGPERATNNWWKTTTCNARKYPAIILQHVCKCPITSWPKDKGLRQIKPAVVPSTPSLSLFLSWTNKNTTLGANPSPPPCVSLVLSPNQSQSLSLLEVIIGVSWFSINESHSRRTMRYGMWAVMTGRLADRQADKTHKNKQEDKEADKAWRQREAMRDARDYHCATEARHTGLFSPIQTWEVVRALVSLPSPAEDASITTPVQPRAACVQHNTHTSVFMKASDSLLWYERQSVIAAHEHTPNASLA